MYRLISTSIVFLWACSGRVAAQPSTGCNDQSRTVQIVAGFHNSLEEQCGTFSIDVAGVGFTSPSKCLKGAANYAGTVYSCGGTSTGIDCNPNGYQVSIQLLNGGACPDLLGLVTGGSFPSWDDVPEAIVTALSCVPPSITETFDWSASTTRCNFGSQSMDDVGTVVTSPSGEIYTISMGDPQPLLNQSVANVFMSAYDAAQSPSVTQIAAPLADVLADYGVIQGLELTAEVTVTHGAPYTNTHVAQLQGRLFADGRFDLTETVLAAKDGVVDPLSRRLICDGSAVALLSNQAEDGLAWSVGSAALDEVLPTLTLSVWPLYRWLVDPFDIPTFEDLDYAVSTDAATSVTAVTRLHDPSQGAAAKVYQLDDNGAVSHPASISVLDPSGLLRRQVVFGDHKTVADGVWRPFSVERQEFLSPGSQAGDVVVSVRIIRTRVLGGTEFEVDLPSDPNQRWLIWQ